MRKNGRAVIVGTSLDVESDEVVRVGLDVASRLGAQPILVHAFQPPALAPAPFGPLGNEAAWIDLHREGLEKRLEAQRVRLAAPSDAVSRLQMGAPFEVILQVAELSRAELVVVGAVSGGVARHPFGLGSTAERLARLGATPLLVVRSGAFHPPRKVLFPIDASPLSGGALGFGLELLAAMAIDRATARALFVLHPLDAERGVPLSPARLERFAADELERFVRRHAGGETVPIEIRSGHARKTIVDVLAEQGTDLAVLGTRGLSGIERLLIGSVAAGVVRDAPCNVLVIPAVVADAAARRATAESVSGAG